jgi:hypothetical protein
MYGGGSTGRGVNRSQNQEKYILKINNFMKKKKIFFFFKVYNLYYYSYKKIVV